MEWLLHGFLLHGFIAGVLASIACGCVGTLVVVNRMSFIAGGVAHAAYGGLGLAVFLRLPPAAGTLPFSMVSALVMGYAAGRNHERADVVVGAIWAAGMALGIILLELTPGYHADLMSYLFGSIVAVSGTDLVLMAILDMVIIASVILLYKELLAVSYDAEYATITGIPAGALRYVQLCLITCTVVMLIQVVGLILVIALFTIPASIAEIFTKRLDAMMRIAVAVGIAITTAGLLLSYLLDLSAGATITLVACASYGILYCGKTVASAGRQKSKPGNRE